MGFLDDLLGKTAEKAANRAAADQYAKQQAAVEKLLGYGDEYADDFRGLSRAYDPFVRQAGELSGAGNDALLRLIADPSTVRSLPGYAFDQEEGIKALDRSAAARGMLNSGRHSKDLMRFGTGLADKTFGDQFSRLLGLNQQGFNQGMAATGARTNTIGQGLTGQLGARTTAYGGDMGSAGTIGQGMIAGANARAQGTQNALNAAAKIGGMALSAFTGMPPIGVGGGGSMGGLNSQATGGWW